MHKVMTSAVDVRRPSQHHSGRFIVFSSADAASDGAGYWSNEFGWVADRQYATVFSRTDSETMNLPVSRADDAMWLEVLDSQQ